MKLPDDPSSKARVFISYRRRGGRDAADHIAAELSTSLPDAVFHDAQIAAGADFLDAIERRLDVCDVLVAVIHPHWSVVEDGDFVRLELATALARGLAVIPVLVDGAPLPRAGELPPELGALERCEPVDLDAVGLAARVERHLDAADAGRAAFRPVLEDRNGNLCWTGVLRGEQETVYAALLRHMARAHRTKWIDVAAPHEIALLRRTLTHVASLHLRFKPAAMRRTTAVEISGEPELQSMLESTIAGAVATRRVV